MWIIGSLDAENTEQMVPCKHAFGWMGEGQCADGTVPVVGGRHATSVAGAGLPVFIKV